MSGTEYDLAEFLLEAWYDPSEHDECRAVCQLTAIETVAKYGEEKVLVFLDIANDLGGFGE